jgi:hypothetical protein
MAHLCSLALVVFAAVIARGAELDEHGAIDISDPEPVVAKVVSDVEAATGPLDDEETEVLGFANAGVLMHFGEEDFDEFCPFGFWLSLVYAPARNRLEPHCVGVPARDLLQVRIGCALVQASGACYG